MATTELGHRDVFGLKVGPAGAVVQVFQVRRGRVVERIELGTDAATVGASAPEVLTAAIQQFYETHEAPPEIHVPLEPEEREALEAWLSSAASHRVRIVTPQRGEKRGLVDLATRNAALGYQNRFNESTTAQYDGLETLRAVLSLPSLPRRIECFDISTIQGSETVASMVVCEDGRMRRSEYRKFRIRPEPPSPRPLFPAPEPRTAKPQPQPRARHQDDFASMRQVVGRRYKALLEQGGPFPDLVLIDGGIGQLSAAYAALEALGLANLVAVGLAKKEELLYTRHHPRSHRPGRKRSGPAAAPEDQGRSPPVRADLSSARADDARSAVGAGPCSRHRPEKAADAADAVWQSRRRAAGLARRFDGGGRSESRGRRPCLFRRSALT